MKTNRYIIDIGTMKTNRDIIDIGTMKICWHIIDMGPMEIQIIHYDPLKIIRIWPTDNN